MKLHVESFGRVGAGSAFLYTLTNASGAYVSITDYSGAVVALGVPEKKDRVEGDVAGFREVEKMTAISARASAETATASRARRLISAARTTRSRPTRAPPRFCTPATSAFTPGCGTFPVK